MQPPELAAPAGSEAWLDATGAARVFHLRRGQRRLRADRPVLTGQSVGLVLSGGGARAYAHVGAIKALRERGVPIDFVGGSSMGAWSAPAWPWAGTRRRWTPAARGLRQHQPAGRHRAAAAGHDPRVKVERAAGYHFGDTQIAPTCGCRSSASSTT
jgi:NTE family protein